MYFQTKTASKFRQLLGLFIFRTNDQGSLEEAVLLFEKKLFSYAQRYAGIVSFEAPFNIINYKIFH